MQASQKQNDLPAYTRCAKLCVKSDLQSYISRTKELWSKLMLFISISQPRKQFTSSTMIIRIKSVLISSWALEAGLLVKDIMNVAD